MSRVPSKAVRPARSVASSPAVAGFRPAGAALAVAAAFALQPLAATAQATGAQVIQGSASFARSGGNLTVRTHNGAGTNFSAINWQSFSVPAGTVTRFDQPSATSTSINRVVGSDPSAIFGTLSSNGRLVLVNPAGITVGQGAVVDTAAFTASTLNMSDADALAGRLLFGAPSGGLLQVDGKVIARSGDVVLVAPQLQAGASALIQSQGATVLAAGHGVEITGRGLEGIRMEVQAGDQAVNLGTLQGDAVGVFANTLHHSGVIEAQAVSTDGGKVVLRASGGNALVDGTITARAVGGHGGAIDVFGQRVGLLADANLDASGATGGGQVRIGGDYQGRNAGVPNAARTYVDAQATIRADATQQGDGGRVIVWSDEATRMDGRISARGGAQGGNGGFIEVSSHEYLAFRGGVDLSAPQGRNGNLLLDPDDITITATGPDTEPWGTTPSGDTHFNGGGGESTISAGTLNSILAGGGNVLVTTSNGSLGAQDGQITLASGATLNWGGTNSLSLNADAGIALDGNVQASTGTLSLVALNGSISQGVASNVLIGNLLASATNGSVTLTSANNRVTGNLAGSATGSGAGFSVTDNDNLTIGSVAAGPVSSPYASGSGINADGAVSVTTSGAMTVAPSVGVQGGSVTLSAAGLTTGNSAIVGASAPGGALTITSTAGIDFGTGSASVFTNRGAISITAASDILGNVNLATFGSADATGVAGSVMMTTTGGALSFGNIETATNADDALHGGNVTLQAAGNVAGSNIAANGGSSSSLAGGGGGAVRITSSGGSIGVGDIGTYGGNAPASFGSLGGGLGGNITLLAKSAIGGLAFDATGGSGQGGGAGAHGGTVSITSSAGTIGLQSVGARGGSSDSGTAGRGGDITVSAAGDVSTPATEGFNVDSGGGTSTQGQGGDGGTITIGSSAGQVSVGTINSTGGDSGAPASNAPGSLPGGAAGGITISAQQAITLQTIQATGGYASAGDAGAGGTISIVSAGDGIDVTGGITAHGGSVNAGSAGAFAGGQGGAVTVNAVSDITVTGTGFPIDAEGGVSSAGTAGAGGKVTLTSSGGSIGVFEPAAVVPLLTAAAAPSAAGAPAGVTAAGGSGGTGAHGGSVLLDAAGPISVGSLVVDGGPSTGATRASGNAGGAGGTILVENRRGNLDLSGVSVLSAGGGSGGSAVVGGTGSGGVGGAGGAISLSAAGGSVVLANNTLFAAGGQGGLEADDSTRAASGAAGALSVASAAVEVQANVTLDAHWANSAVVDVHGSSTVSGSGAVANTGTLNLLDTSSFAPGGGVDNRAGGQVATGSGAAASVTLLQNEGNVNVVAGSSLTVPGTFTNTGTVNVDGTLDAGVASASALVAAQALAPAVFTNQAAGLLTGAGTISLAGGRGSLDNFGTVAPAGQGPIGTLSLQGNLTMEPGSTLAIDLLSPSAYDVLNVSGHAQTGGSVAVSYQPATSFASGQVFQILRAGGLDAASMPSINVTQLTLKASPATLDAVANTPVPASAPPPAPAPAPSAAVQEVNNQVVTFAQLFVQEAQNQQDHDKPKDQDDIVLTDNACKP